MYGRLRGRFVRNMPWHKTSYDISIDWFCRVVNYRRSVSWIRIIFYGIYEWCPRDGLRITSDINPEPDDASPLVKRSKPSAEMEGAWFCSIIYKTLGYAVPRTMSNRAGGNVTFLLVLQFPLFFYSQLRFFSLFFFCLIIFSSGAHLILSLTFV